MLFIIYKYEIKIIDVFSYITKKIICNLILMLNSYYLKKNYVKIHNKNHNIKIIYIFITSNKYVNIEMYQIVKCKKYKL